MTTHIVYVAPPFIVSEETNYQGFHYNFVEKKCTPTGSRTPMKWDAVKNVFPDIVKNNVFLDIGANFGFFNFKAIEHGCSRTIGIEGKPEYYESLNNVLKIVVVPKFRYVFGMFPDVKIEADVVMGVSLIHHLFPGYNVRRCVELLYGVTKKFLIVEWMDINDKFGRPHMGYQDYRKDNFEKLLGEYFSSYEFISHGHHDTRFIYLAKV